MDSLARLPFYYNYEGIKSHARNQNKVVYGISPTNKQPDRKNEPRVGTVPLYVH